MRHDADGYAGANPEGFGGADYVPVSGDYDGDGKADLALYLPAEATLQAQAGNSATATWLFRLSSLNYTQFSTTF